MGVSVRAANRGRCHDQFCSLAGFGIARRLCENFVCALDESPRCGQVAIAKLLPSIDKDFESRASAVPPRRRSSRRNLPEPRLASNVSLVRFVPMIPRFASYAVSLLAIAFLISACASRDEGVIEESTSQSEARVPDKPTFTPGAIGSSASHW